MNQKYKDDLLIVKKYFHKESYLTPEENNKNMRLHIDAVNRLCSTKDQEVLESLLDFFTKENEQYGGVCENLESDITDNFSIDQVLQVFYKKYNFLANNDLDRCIHFSMWFLWGDKFDEFREMFNTVRPELADKLLAEMLSWDTEYAEHINLLRDDMKSW